ncbi:uncharacterized protein NFIA_027430 [Aspergillus fischeri NRRL 181]|uniref:Serine protease n=1 Tax=Neosartorya fischeri (strain ATCC 1020 / DSM 3700 / CBS 544.65 / FGSC A1164 / JCM 1740 / NRRL 181 / WB 181) TaxID=331117 RepID=A1DCV9_NEOFI|nr:conserved hypothetical protein [Aspergillus fischeri NRRL 181]EAW19669.1 conserved hypothetical protein [Aspergillus fischeri NRRL 181]KAG2021936.1 hypothetical protein GB937_004490 [Aspergillus fischeri]
MPGAKKPFILTAAHNIINKNQDHSENIVMRIKGLEKKFPIHRSTIRICPAYEKNPTTAAEEADWALIFTPDELEQEPARAGIEPLGFALKLAYEERLDCEMRVTGVPISNNKNNPNGAAMVPVTTTGKCLNPIVFPAQLEYTATTEKGLSGSPVWTMYNGVPTVLAIHNNGTRRKKYSRGTRLTFEVLRQICVWADCEKRDQLIRINSQTPLPLYLAYAPAFGVLHVVVKEADDPQLMRFNIIPVLAAEAAPKDIEKSRSIQFGLYQTHNGQPHWVSWNIDQFTAGTGTATMVSDRSRARVARGWQDGAGKPFRILVDSSADPYKLVVLLNRASTSRLTWEGEEFSILSFRKFRQAQPSKNPSIPDTFIQEEHA